MELEQRVKILEGQVNTLKNDVQKTLAEIQATLPEKPATPGRWQRKAWGLALLNILMAITLFANVYVYRPAYAPFAINSFWTPWLRALWIAIAFMWLLLQLYPLALLLEQEDQQWQRLAWRNAIGYFYAHPGLMVGLTLVVLVVALVNAVFPVMWFVIGIVILIAVIGAALRQLVDMRRERAHTQSRSK